MTAATVSSKYQIVIPKEAREKLHIVPGTRLQITQEGDSLRLAKEPTLEEIRGLLKGMQWDESEVRDETDRELP
ncbi:MAG: AbrB/MazE/SpoVT family DNA-binding domain-containing protein [Terrimicrobiaceae bacterium]|nr:AbrB/MazE/SpoVT family DNA-binding domain-containing protein [Terrimicrobiaceae bacterium]